MSLTGDPTMIRQIGTLVRETCPSETAFALFVGGGAGGFVSNADRGDVVESLREWLGKMRTTLGKARGGAACGAVKRVQSDRDFDVEAQASLVTICAILGDGIERAWRTKTAREPLSVFFLFEVGGPGKLTAWRANGRPSAVVTLLESWLFRLEGVTSSGGDS